MKTMFNLNLKGKKAVVTGAATGIGQAIAVELALHRAGIAINYRNSAGAAAETVNKICANGGECVAIQGDVTKEAEVERLIKTAVKELGGIDILVNNVGDFFYSSLMNTSVDEFESVLASNLTSVFLTCKAVVPLMSERGGVIINVGLSPMDRVRGAANVGAYSIAKSGVLILSKTLAQELAEKNIRVNVVSPGLIDNGHLPKEQAEWMRQRVPFKRLGTSAEVAAAVVFLASPAASYISGADLSVSGGWDWLNRPVEHDFIVDELFGAKND